MDDGADNVLRRHGIYRGTSYPDIALHGDNNDPSDIFYFDGNDQFYVPDHFHNNFYVYDASFSNTLGTVTTSGPFIRGLTYINGNFYSVDANDTVYVADNYLNYQWEWALHSDNDDATAICVYNDQLYVTDSWDDRVYVYSVSGVNATLVGYFTVNAVDMTGITYWKDSLYIMDNWTETVIELPVADIVITPP